MPSDKRPAALPPALIVWVLAVAVAAAPGLAVGEFLLAAAPQDPSVVERSLELQRSTRRLIQQGLRNEGLDPGTPDGLFGPRPRAAIRDWQESRGASPTGYLTGAEAELLRTAAAPPPAPDTPPLPEAVPAAAPTASSAAAASTSAETDSSPAPPATVGAEEVDPQNAVETNTQQRPRAPGADGTVQLPPEILDAALAAMNEILAL